MQKQSSAKTRSFFFIYYHNYLLVFQKWIENNLKMLLR